jgi:hypothetical protein
MTKTASITKVAASKAASIMSAADALTPEQAVSRAYEIADLNRELSVEEKLEFAALMYGPCAQYIA